MGRINGDRRLPDFPTRNEKVTIPLWMVTVDVLFRLAGRLLLALARRPIPVGVTVGLVYLYVRAGWLGLLVLAGVLVAVGGLWRLVHRRSAVWAGRLLWGRVRLVFVYRLRWRPVMIHSGLAIRVPLQNGDRVRFEDTFPRISRFRHAAGVDRFRVELLYGQTVETWREQAEALRLAFRARTCRVRADTKIGYVRLEFARTDPLARPVRPADIDPQDDDGEPDADGLIDRLDGLPVGRTEDGDVWRIRLRGTHVLVAGATGSGKGSVLWSLVRALRPAVRAGLVEIWACDPKGGMELGFGRRLFARFATDPEQIADLLDDAVGVMRDRAESMQGRTRLHVPSMGEPLIVLLVDELASLTAYVTDRELKRRLGAALPLLLSQGRAPGVVLVGAVQDPRKETVPFRDLFPLRVCLRTTEADHADLILGAGSYARGARADEIPEALAGVGYVQADGQAEPVRVRAGHVTDDEIDRMATAGDPDPARIGDLLVPTQGGWVPVIPAAEQGEGWDATDGDGWAA